MYFIKCLAEELCLLPASSLYANLGEKTHSPPDLVHVHKRSNHLKTSCESYITVAHKAIYSYGTLYSPACCNMRVPPSVCQSSFLCFSPGHHRHKAKHTPCCLTVLDVQLMFHLLTKAVLVHRPVLIPRPFPGLLCDPQTQSDKEVISSRRLGYKGFVEHIREV